MVTKDIGPGPGFIAEPFEAVGPTRWRNEARLKCSTAPDALTQGGLHPSAGAPGPAGADERMSVNQAFSQLQSRSGHPKPLPRAQGTVSVLVALASEAPATQLLACFKGPPRSQLPSASSVKSSSSPTLSRLEPKVQIL